MFGIHAAKSVISALGAVVLVAAGLLSTSAAEAADTQAHERVVLQVSDDNPKTWNQALNVIENLQESYGKQNVDVELVAFGLGIGILKLESVAGNRVQEALRSGARVVACEVTMRRQKLVKADMLSNIDYVPGGVVEIIAKERQGWAVIRP